MALRDVLDWIDRHPVAKFVTSLIGHIALGCAVTLPVRALGVNPVTLLNAAAWGGFIHGREQQQSTSRKRFDPHFDWLGYFVGAGLPWWF